MSQQARRASRAIPAEGDHTALVDFLLETEVEDMEYEVARCRPLLTPAFMAWLDSALSDEKAKVSGKRREDRIDELTSLQVVLVDELAKLAKHHAALGVAAERFKGLLAAADKRAALLDLVSHNHVDRALLEVRGLLPLGGRLPVAAFSMAGQRPPSSSLTAPSVASFPPDHAAQYRPGEESGPRGHRRLHGKAAGQGGGIRETVIDRFVALRLKDRFVR